MVWLLDRAAYYHRPLTDFPGKNYTLIKQSGLGNVVDRDSHRANFAVYIWSGYVEDLASTRFPIPRKMMNRYASSTRSAAGSCTLYERCLLPRGSHHIGISFSIIWGPFSDFEWRANARVFFAALRFDISGHTYAEGGHWVNEPKLSDVA